MFYDCKKLNYITSDINKDYLGNDYTSQWLHNVASPGTYYDRNSQLLNQLLTTRNSSTVPDYWNIDEGVVS